MLNTPGHMHAVVAAMSELGISGNLQVSGKPGCLNLEKTVAVSFTKELVSKYVKYLRIMAAISSMPQWMNIAHGKMFSIIMRMIL